MFLETITPALALFSSFGTLIFGVLCLLYSFHKCGNQYLKNEITNYKMSECITHRIRKRKYCFVNFYFHYSPMWIAVLVGFFFLSLKGILKVSLNFSHGFHLFYLWALCLDVFLVLDFLSLVSFNTDAEYLSQNVFAQFLESPDGHLTVLQCCIQMFM